MADQQQAGHSVPSSSVVYDQTADPEIVAFQEHQRTAPRLTLAEESRTLITNGSFGVLSTISAGNDGYPFGSVVEYGIDADGCPVFAFSTLSPHTADVKKDGRCSLTVMADSFSGLADARVCITGDVMAVADAATAAVREAYLAKHPNSFWVDFGDFSWFKLKVVKSARLVGGFGRVGSVSAAEYAAAAVDPVAQYSAPVCGHMNDDHAESITAMVKQYAGLTVDSARMLSLDRLGVNVACSREGQSFKARLPFPSPATDRKSIKELIVQMTREAAAAAKK